MKNIASLLIVLLLIGCTTSSELDTGTISKMSTDDLIEIIKDESSPNFLPAINEIKQRGGDAANAAPFLARALQYNRRDSYMAGIALIEMGPVAEKAIPYLIPALRNERADVRTYANYSLGAIGKNAECAVPEVAKLLWDTEPTVRTTAANAIEWITGDDLVPSKYQLNLSHPNSIIQDLPEGIVTNNAREWWLSSGQHTNWPTANCDMSE